MQNNERLQNELLFIGGLLFLSGNNSFDINDYLEVVNLDNFTDERCKIVFLAIQQAVNDGIKVEFVDIAQKSCKLNNNVTRVFVSEIVIRASEIVTKSTLNSLAKQISDQAKFDIVKELINESVAYSETIHGLDIVRKCAEKTIDILDDTADNKELMHISKLIPDYLTELVAGRSNKKPVPTPWASLNRVLKGGFVGGEFIILAARPSVGKTAFALNLALSVASHKPTLFISLEMATTPLMDRLTACVADIDVSRFREGNTATCIDKIRGALKIIGVKKLELIDKPRTRTRDIIKLARRVKKKYGDIGIAIVDYLQLVTPDERTGSREQDVSTMSRNLKLFAKELDVPVIALAQLNRNVEAVKREPILSDLRESGSLEQDSDIVIFLHQETAVKEYNSSEKVKVIVAKGRSSGVGNMYLTFHRKQQRMEESNETEWNNNKPRVGHNDL